MVPAGRADAIRVPIFGTEAAEAVESVGDGASEPEVGGAEVFVLRWEMVPIAGEVLISVGLLVGVTSERTDSVDPPLGRGVMKLPGLPGAGGEEGSSVLWFLGVAASMADGGGSGGRGGDEPCCCECEFKRDLERGGSSTD